MNFQTEQYTNSKKILILITFIILIIILSIGIFVLLYSYLSDENKNETETLKQIENEEGNINIDFAVLPMHSAEELKIHALPIANENSQQQIKDIYSSDEKQIYLTFDDGPSDLTPQILDILKEEDVKATFFLLGSRVDLKPEIVKREFEEGHFLANHGSSHQYGSIYSSPQATLDEYLSCEQSIRNAIGLPEYSSHMFRFPGGSSGGRYENTKAGSRKLLNENNIPFTNWNCLTGDAEAVGRTEQQLLSRLYETIGDQKSLIVLMHDAADKQATVNTLKTIIQDFKSKGYEFKTFYDVLK